METPRSLLWTGIGHFSTEFLTISHYDQRWRIEGRVITAFADLPAFASYTIICNEAWQTRHVSASCRYLGAEHTVTLHRDDHGWTIDGATQADLAGCTDIDLELTPFTNSLPINRLQLAIGDEARVDAVWLRFPGLTVEPLHQCYTRIAANRYRYESGASFQATLDVDDDGIVIRYENGWEQPAFTRNPNGA
jgi:uncharacterized protein